MPERTEYAPGVPSWIDIGTDVEGAKQFYGSLFGWSAQDAGPPEETGGYGFFLKDGKMVAGYGPQQNPGPPVWATYISVADADETAKKVEQAGGNVILAPDGRDGRRDAWRSSRTPRAPSSRCGSPVNTRVPSW